MAIPANLSRRNTAAPQSTQGAILAEFNKLVTQVRVLTAKLDADAGVTDTNYAALVTAADSASPAKIDVI